MQVPGDVQRIAGVFRSNGYDLFVVGGAVRDALLGKRPKDYDLVTNALPDHVEFMFKDLEWAKTLPIGKAFGIISVVVNGEPYEIATFRTETYLKSEGRNEFIKFIERQGSEYAERLRLFVARSKRP